MVEASPQFDVYRLDAEELIKKYLKKLRLDITFGYKFSEKSLPNHSWGNYQNPSVYFYGEYRNGKELPIAALNHDGILRFLIPNNQRILEVVDVKNTGRDSENLAKKSYEEVFRGYDRGGQY